MRAMAYKLFSSLKGHPLISAFAVLLLFSLPIFHVLIFFWPLIVSTALGVLAVASFGRQPDEHTMPSAGCDSVESVGRPDIIAFPPYEEKISNVLMVGSQEVTWLEWLHNEDTQKLCARECEPAVWNAHGCDISSMASDTNVDAPASQAEDKLSVHTNGSTCKDEGSGNASLCANDEGRLYACGSRGEGETPVSALVLTGENETRATMITSTVVSGFRATAIVLEDANKDETKVTVPILTAKDETNLDTTGEDQMCKFGSTGKDERTENAMERNGISFTVNEETKNEVNGSASTGGDEIVGALVSTIDSESVMNKSVPALEAESGVDALEFPSATEAISHTSEPKIALINEEDAPDLPSLNKSAKVHEMPHVDNHDEEETGSKHPQWDVSDGEEDQSSLRFSFFHNSSFTPSVA